MRAPVAVFLALLLLVPAMAFGQTQQYQVLKSERNETFELPYSAANRDSDNPLVYTYDQPKGPNWILTLTNNLAYTTDNSSKIIIHINEPAPSEKYIEVAMYGGEQKKFWVAVNIPGTGYARLYEENSPGWSTENPIQISNEAITGLSMTDGKRIILDRFDIGGFTVGSVSVYGKDASDSPDNAVGGNVTFDILFGSFDQSPLFLLPALVMAGVGAIVGTLLIVKKRKPNE